MYVYVYVQAAVKKAKIEARPGIKVKNRPSSHQASHAQQSWRLGLSDLILYSLDTV